MLGVEGYPRFMAFTALKEKLDEHIAHGELGVLIYAKLEGAIIDG
jgi:hypothetical protein